MPDSATYRRLPSGETAMPLGPTPRRLETSAESTMRLRQATLQVVRSMRSTMSLLPLETYSAFPLAARKFGALPPTALPRSHGAPTSRPVLMRQITFGFAASAASIPHTENDSGTFGSPRPGTLRPSTSTPSRASLLGN